MIQTRKAKGAAPPRSLTFVSDYPELLCLAASAASSAVFTFFCGLFLDQADTKLHQCVSH